MKRRALISVYDKDNVLSFCQFLISRDIEIISTGGTYKYLKENKIAVKEISEVTNFPEMLDGRVKTLHPNIHAGILAIRQKTEHMNKLKDFKIDTIDFVVVNLYPFFEKVRSNISFDEKVEFIDIGGPTMLRAAAKNFHDVTVICDKHDYARVQKEMEHGEVSLVLKQELAGKVFNLMSAYDGAVAQFLLQQSFPEYLSLSYCKKQDLRYGENPHQAGCFYGNTTLDGAMNTFQVLNGKELSYNNFKDVDIAWKAVSDFEEPACCALKHNTPCGFAIGKDAHDAYTKAYQVDPTSIFGGIVSFNRKVTKDIANELVKIFLEVIAAPEYDDDALAVLKTKKNLRVLKFLSQPKDPLMYISVDGGMLVQSNDDKFIEEIKVVTELKPSDAELKDLLFAMRVVKFVKSNAIVVAKDGVAIGIGGGQVNRIWPTKDALTRGKGARVLASDAFFPFRDVVDEAAKCGIKAIIQPGGSLRDQESIDAANEHKIAMIFTGIRHFKH